MTDIVERLRGWADRFERTTPLHKAMLREAAAEIERLTAELRGIKDRVDIHLNNYLCEMKPGYDDSITGFNGAWDIVRKTFEAALKDTTPMPENKDA